eukprot:TRINITY_DN889_c0_g2_i2.p1 TRINITY_DN889_c0_g2~~TRINITY_DN889_c0_g2_i2.p1  ORF type:complete len:131 (+),score=3.77 TRINITY_DN889_c0_g2_i2:42-434(+)
MGNSYLQMRRSASPYAFEEPYINRRMKDAYWSSYWQDYFYENHHAVYDSPRYWDTYWFDKHRDHQKDLEQKNPVAADFFDQYYDPSGYKPHRYFWDYHPRYQYMPREKAYIPEHLRSHSQNKRGRKSYWP